MSNPLMTGVVEPLRDGLLSFGTIGMLAWIVLKILAIAVPVIVAVAFYVVWERKLIGWMHVRHGPMYVGMGILQAFADVFKLLFKEVLQPTVAHTFLYVLAPLIALVPAFAAWAVVPFDAQVVLSNANAGLLYLLAMTSLGVYGIIMAGWASNSKYAFLGAMRARCAGRQLRDRDGLRPGRRADRRRQPEPVGHRDGPGRQRRVHSSGSGCRCCRCSWCTSYPAWPRPTARRSTWSRANRKSSPGTWWSTRVRSSRCSSWPNTPT